MCPKNKLCRDDKCIACYELSFASHEKSSQWHPKNILSARNVMRYTKKKYWFACNKCRHAFEKKISIIVMYDSWCPYCSGFKLCDDEHCGICFDRSFSSHEKVRYWSALNGNINPRFVFRGSLKRYWFDCECGHKFNMQMETIGIANYWCPYCCSKIPRVLCNEESCEMCYAKSFASHPRSKNWSPKNQKTPREVLKGTKVKYWFDCDAGDHDFYSSICKIVDKKNPRWCPLCKRKTELKLYKYLSQKYNVARQKIFEWCKNEKTSYSLPFDFLIGKFNVIIELDGPQHFRQVGNWTSAELTQKMDVCKMQKAIENGFTIVRVLQEDVLYDRIDWKTILNGHIKVYEDPCVVYISESDIYDVHKSLMM